MKKKFVSLGLVTLLAPVGWFALAFKPAHSKLGELRAEVGRTRQEVSDLEAQLKRLLELQRNEPKIRAEAARMTTALPDRDPKVSDFIIQVQDAANAAAIDFLTITPSLPAVPAEAAVAASAAQNSSTPPSSSGTAEGTAAPAPPTTPLRSISVQIKADGRYFEIEQFVLKLEHLARALRIDDFSLSTGNQEDAGVLSASMKLQIFMLVPQAAAGGAGGQTAQGTSGAA